MTSTETDTVSFPRQLGVLAGEHPDAEAVRFVDLDGTEHALTWAELDRRSSQVAGAFRERGVDAGDLVGIGFPNSAELVLSAFGAWKLGAVPVPVRWDLPEWELQRLRDVVGAKLHLEESDRDWIAATADAEVPDLPDAVSPHMNGICSSGSTGTPKVILVNRPAVFYEMYSTPMMNAWREIPRPQTILVLAPMYHANGFTTLYNLLGGDRLIVLRKFDAERIVDLIERHRVTNFTATPTMLKRIADVPGIDERDLSSIEWFIQGAAMMPPTLVDRWIELVGAEKILMAYGMTEAIGITALIGTEWLEHRGSVGTGLRGTEIKILDAESNELPTGEVGDIYMRAPAYGGSTYLGAGQLTPTDDGFMTVGDMGWLDDDGYLYLADRRADLIISGGANVFPAEVENALIDHPKIADVVVIGLQDPEWGRRVHAIIAPKDPADPPTHDEIVAYSKSRLAAYKVPKTIEVVDEIPRSAATKVNRRALIEAREDSA
jgi:bile acid-coenzyme A ligase